MAKLSARLTLTSTDWHTDSLSINQTASLLATGDEQAIGRYTTSTTDSKIPVGVLDSTDKKAYVYLKNLSTDAAEKIVIKEDSSGSVGSAFAVLGPNEWMFFPYGENDYLWVDAASGAPVIEYAIFEA
tara:strand:+ start:248 stop:631 length:384 start_codon:yes stop_codon:yes gene_type:complete